MVHRTVSGFRQILFFSVIVIIIKGCVTIDYSRTQADFNRGDYQAVTRDLPETKIQDLDRKLQFNAYTLKAYSEWQTGKLAEAKQTAATAMAKPGLVAGPRDKLLMTILPTLIDEQELNDKYRQLPDPKQITIQPYKNDYENGYSQVVTSLKNAYDQAPADVPQTSLDYVHCQRGRALENWWTVMNHIWDGVNSRSPGTLDLKKEAYDRAQKSLRGNDIQAEIKQEKKFPCPESKELLTAKGAS